jgi:predicted metal-dependent HD superfamily phosphohydrolase
VVTESAEARWDETWRLAERPAPPSQLQALVARYRETHRAYHDVAHVLSCLDLAASVRQQLDVPFEVEIALWYHDAVYEPRASDNEERSAQLAAAELAFLPGPTLAAVSALILATKHEAAPVAHDARFVVDIDLAILGSPREGFEAYEAAIRREYRWVPGPLFRRKRREVLQSFLDRSRIYSTDHFHALLEGPARANLARSVALLS